MNDAAKELLLEKLDILYKKKHTLRLAYPPALDAIKQAEKEEAELQTRLQDLLKRTIPDDAPKERKEEYLCYVDWSGAMDFDVWLMCVEELEEDERKAKEGR